MFVFLDEFSDSDSDWERGAAPPGDPPDDKLDHSKYDHVTEPQIMTHIDF